MLVGDDYQSIYSFRGANIDNILDFKHKFDDAKLFKLERNYRSTQLIVQAANSLMKHNERQIPKDVFSKEAEGDKILYKPCYSDREEAMVVANELKRIKRNDDCDYGNFAILYRTNAQSRSFEDEFRKQVFLTRLLVDFRFINVRKSKISSHISAWFLTLMTKKPSGVSSITQHVELVTRPFKRLLIAPNGILYRYGKLSSILFNMD